MKQFYLFQAPPRQDAAAPRSDDWQMGSAVLRLLRETQRFDWLRGKSTIAAAAEILIQLPARVRDLTAKGISTKYCCSYIYICSFFCIEICY